jgi:hypothetical protein
MKKTFLTILSVSAFAAFNAIAAEKAMEIDSKENSRRVAIEQIPACANILNECKKLGFVAGGYKEGNGLWRNCFHPTIKGKAATQKGKEVSVAVNANDISSCKNSAKEHLKNAKMAESHHEMKSEKAMKKAKAQGVATSTAVTQ